MLVAVSPAPTVRRNRCWLFQCDCGATKVKPLYKVCSGYTKSCGCLTPWVARNSSGTIVRSKDYSDGYALYKEWWTRYYSDGCSLEQYIHMSKQPCHYCGRIGVGQRTKYGTTIRCNGLDRIDSTKDHSPSNIVTCCKDCNRAKSNMSYEDFIRWITELYLNIILVESKTRLLAGQA